MDQSSSTDGKLPAKKHVDESGQSLIGDDFPNPAAVTVENAPAPTAQPHNNDSDNDKPAVPMSKSAMKRKRRYEHLMEVKQRRKKQAKEAKIVKAQAEGRDLDDERRRLAERTAAGVGQKRRQEIWDKYRLPHAQKTFQICVDCAFESSMTYKEINSLSSQIRYCYAANKKSSHPSFLTATSLDGKTLEHLQKVSGFDEWNKRAFSHTKDSLEEYYKDKLDKVVYLTSDSNNTLTDLEDDKIYVIGGIVDRNRLKRVAIQRAEALGIATAKLPIDEHLQKMEATRVLTCNHVCEILLKYRKNGKDWQKTLLDVLPQRKAAKAIEASSSSSNADVEK